MIKAEHLTKRYGERKAIDDLSFTIETGKITGFLGPNGAGKSTTMNIIAGYISASEGRALINGVDILEEPEEVKRQIGYLPEFPPLYMDMTVEEYIDFAGELKGLSKKAMKMEKDRIFNLLKIADIKGRLIKNLSKGYKQRAGLAQALVGSPPLLILDEPTSGLDPKQILQIRSLISALRKDHTIVLSSHILPDVQAVCDQALIINNGKIVANDSPQALAKKLAGGESVSLRAQGDRAAIRSALEGIGSVKTIEEKKSEEEGACDFLIIAQGSLDIRPDIFYALAKVNAPILSMRSGSLSLEEIFLKLTSDSNKEP